MLSKEEIEKAKEELNNYIIIINKTKDTEYEWHGYYNNELHELKRDIETLLQYIDQLEQENKDTYWKGYIQRQNEAVEICKMCKYRKQYLKRNAEEAKQYFEKKVEEK